MLPLPRLPLVSALAAVATVGSSFALEVPDFALSDENDTSPRSGQLVSPRDYRHQVTAWYFGAAT